MVILSVLPRDVGMKTVHGICHARAGILAVEASSLLSSRYFYFRFHTTDRSRSYRDLSVGILVFLAVWRGFPVSGEAVPSCVHVDTLAVPLQDRTCWFNRDSSGSLHLTCGAVCGYRPVGDIPSVLHYREFVYSLQGDRTPSGARCMYKFSSARIRVSSDHEYKNVSHVDADSDYTSGKFGTDVQNVLFSEGFRSLHFEFDSEALGCRAVLDTDPNCSNCTIRLRVMNFPPTEKEDRLILQYARKVDLRFVESFVGLSKFYFFVLNGSTILRELRVTGGRFWGSTRDMLAEWPGLRRLELSYTGLPTLETENFQAIPNLQELRLSHNAFEQVPEGISILSNLTMLDLSWNPMSTENLVKVLTPLQNLQWLFLSNASLHSMDALLPLLASSDDDSPYAVLLGLDLSFCRLQSVDTDTARAIFRRQTELRNLSLAGNPLGHIPADLFQSLARLSTLNLSRTEIASPPGLLLAPGITLSVLDLSHNLLTTPTGTLSQGTALALTLSGNPLRPWDDQTAFLGVRSMDLSNCSLSELTAPMLRSFDSSTVDLTDNLLDCAACSVPDLRRWLQDHPTLISPAPLRCSLPPAQMGRSVMEAAWSEAACRDNTALIIGASLGLLLALFLLVTLLTYRYRFEVRYILHLVRVNRTPNKTEDGDYQYDAFVCYSGSDRLWVLRELLPRLEGDLEGYNLCLHERDFILGSFISHNIVNCIQSSRRTIVVLTNNFVKSQWCQWELEVASHRLLEGTRAFLILIELERLERRHLPRHLRLLMDTRTFLEWPSRECAPEGVWKRLKVAMGPSLKQSAASETGA